MTRGGPGRQGPLRGCHELSCFCRSRPPATGDSCASCVTPDPDPGSIPDSRCCLSRRGTGSTAEAAARAVAGPRIGAGAPSGVTVGVVHGHACLLPGKGRDGMSLFRASSRGRGCGAAGGRIAAARLVRLIARASRHTHLARRFPPGCFSRPQPSLSAETPKGGPGSRLSLLSFYTIPPNVKPIREQKMKMPEIFHGMPTAGTELIPRIID